MKKVIEHTDIAEKGKGGPKIQEFFKRQAERIRHGQFTCPFCKEVSNGISEFGAHLKSHCT